MIIPIRAKNPPERFPYVTLALIAVNTIIYAFTSRHFLVVRGGAVAAMAVSHATLSPGRLLTSMFLHGSWDHILGNMLFLWIFGAALEGRLGPLRYLLVYLIAGMAGGLLSDLVTFSSDPDIANFGASGAIFGLAGAYLYVFPYSHIRVLRVWFFRLISPPEWEARWVVAYFLGINVLEQLQYHGMDGIGHFAHLGGAGAGVLCVWLLRTRRDNADVSAAQAVHANVKDLSLLSFPELDALMQRPTEDPRLVLAFCEKAWMAPTGGEARVLPALQNHARLLMERGDPAALATQLTRLSPAGARQMPSVYFLRLGSRLEAAGDQTPACASTSGSWRCSRPRRTPRWPGCGRAASRSSAAPATRRPPVTGSSSTASRRGRWPARPAAPWTSCGPQASPARPRRRCRSRGVRPV